MMSQSPQTDTTIVALKDGKGTQKNKRRDSKLRGKRDSKSSKSPKPDSSGHVKNSHSLHGLGRKQSKQSMTNIPNFTSADSRRQLRDILGTKSDSNNSKNDKEWKQLQKERSEFHKERQKFLEEKKLFLNEKNNFEISRSASQPPNSNNNNNSNNENDNSNDSQNNNNNSVRSRSTQRSSVFSRNNMGNQKNKQFSSKQEILKKEQNISRQLAQLSKQQDSVHREKASLIKQKNVLEAERKKLEKAKIEIEKERKKFAKLKKKWEKEATDLRKVFESKSIRLEHIEANDKGHSKDYVDARRDSLENHGTKLYNMTDISNYFDGDSNNSLKLSLTHRSGNDNDQSETEMKQVELSSTLSGGNDGNNNNNNNEEQLRVLKIKLETERERLKKMQFEANESQLRAENTLQDLYAQKRELKKERRSIAQERAKYAKHERSFESLAKEKKELRKQKEEFEQWRKKMEAQQGTGSRMSLMEEKSLKDQNERLSKRSLILERKLSGQNSNNGLFLSPRNVSMMSNGGGGGDGLLGLNFQSMGSAGSVASNGGGAGNIGGNSGNPSHHKQNSSLVRTFDGVLTNAELRELKQLRKKNGVYRDRLEKAENKCRILERKLIKMNRFAMELEHEYDEKEELYSKRNTMHDERRSKSNSSGNNSSSNNEASKHGVERSESGNNILIHMAGNSGSQPKHKGKNLNNSKSNRSGARNSQNARIRFDDDNLVPNKKNQAKVSKSASHSGLRSSSMSQPSTRGRARSERNIDQRRSNLQSSQDVQNTRFLISTLRAKISELENKNKLQSKLLKRFKSTAEAYRHLDTLDSTHKMIAKMQTERDEFAEKYTSLRKEYKKRQAYADKYQSKLWNKNIGKNDKKKKKKKKASEKKENEIDSDNDDDDDHDDNEKDDNDDDDNDDNDNDDLGDDLGDDEDDEIDDDDDDLGEDEDEEDEAIHIDYMTEVELKQLVDTMRQQLADLQIKCDSLTKSNNEKEIELSNYEQLGNEWDAQMTLGEGRARVLFAKLRIENDKLKADLDAAQHAMLKERGKAETWQQLIETQLSRGDSISSIMVGQESAVNLIKTLKSELRASQAQVEMLHQSGNGSNDKMKGNVKNRSAKLQNFINDSGNDHGASKHKAIDVDLTDQFGPHFFERLEYIFMDADLRNDGLIKLNIKDKFNDIYNVVLISEKMFGDILNIKKKGKDGKNIDKDEKKEDDDDNNNILKLIIQAQKTFLSSLRLMDSQLKKHEEHIRRIIDMLKHIRQSKKILEWDVLPLESRRSKPAFDMVVSQLRTTMSTNGTQAGSNKNGKNGENDASELSRLKVGRNISAWEALAASQQQHKSGDSIDSLYDLTNEDPLSKVTQSEMVHLTVYEDEEEDNFDGTALSLLPPNSPNVSALVSDYNKKSKKNVLDGSTPDSTRRARSRTFGDNVTSPGAALIHETRNAKDLSRDDVGRIFDYYDSNKDGQIETHELEAVLMQLGVNSSTYANNGKQDDKDEQVRLNKLKKLLDKLDMDKDGVVQKKDFVNWWFNVATEMEFDEGIRSLLYLYGMDFVATKSDELHAFATYLNRIFHSDAIPANKNNGNNKGGSQFHHKFVHKSDVSEYLPIDTVDGGHDLLSKLVDGVILAKMINWAVANTIDERVINRRNAKTGALTPKQIIENLNIVLSSLRSIGVSLGNQVTVEHFLDPHNYETILRRILTQLSKLGLSKNINLKDNPVLIKLADPHEDDETIRSLDAYEWLKRWVNYQLNRAGIDRRIKNFGRDFKDGEVLAYVLQSVTRRKKRYKRFDASNILSYPVYARANELFKVLENHFKIDVFIEPNDLLSGNARLISLLCSQIFAKFPGMAKITDQELEQVNEIFATFDEEDDVNEVELNDQVGDTNMNGNGVSSPLSVDVNDKRAMLLSGKITPRTLKRMKFAEESNMFGLNSNDQNPRFTFTNFDEKMMESNGDNNNNNGNNSNNNNNKNNNDVSSPNVSLVITRHESSNGNEEKTFEREYIDEDHDIVATAIRVEKDITNWVNQLLSNLKDDKLIQISNISKDLRNGVVLLTLMDLIEPKVINWETEVIRKPQNRLQCLQNCHYIVSVIKMEPFLFEENVSGNDIYKSNKHVMRRICLHLLNHYSMKVVSRLLADDVTFTGFSKNNGNNSSNNNKQYSVTEYELLHWCNENLKKLKVPRFCTYQERYIQSWEDSTLKSCLYYLDLLLLADKDIIDRDTIFHRHNRSNANDYTKAECLSNASYCLSLARKLGGNFFISAHDLINVRSSSVTMSFAVCIVTIILTKKKEVSKQKRLSLSHSRRSSKSASRSNGGGLMDTIHNPNNQPSTIDENDASGNDQMSESELNVKNGYGSIHGRKRSVLQDFGLITNQDELNEISDIARQYSAPNDFYPSQSQNDDSDDNDDDDA